MLPQAPGSGPPPPVLTPSHSVSVPDWHLLLLKICPLAALAFPAWTRSPWNQGGPAIPCLLLQGTGLANAEGGMWTPGPASAVQCIRAEVLSMLWGVAVVLGKCPHSTLVPSGLAPL